jgi:hypothetical protein
MLTTIKEHLIINSCHLNFRVLRGPGNMDSLDEEWKEEFWKPIEPQLPGLDA